MSVVTNMSIFLPIFLEIMVLSIHPLYLLLRLHGVGKTTTMGLERGVMFLDPAKLTSRYFRGFRVRF